VTRRQVGVGAALLAVAAVILYLRTPELAPPPPRGDELPPAETEAASESEDPWDASVGLLRQAAAELSSRDPDGSRDAGRESFLDHARELADEALIDKRPDVSASVGRILVEADEQDFAGAILQRAVGLMKADEFGEAHYYALAEVRRAQGRPVEAASLFERVVHAPPTLAAEFVGLSEHYLAADRPGPARAAVDRGLREHPDDVMLRTQGAKTALLRSDLAVALAATVELLTEDPGNLGARLVQVEAQLAAGLIDDAVRSSAALRAEFPDEAWGYIFGAAAARLRGDSAAVWLETAVELAGDCLCTRDQRLAIEWADRVGMGSAAAPRSRVELSAAVRPAP
jgi:tetratricopeptide (TPR) repeat protein